MLAFRNLPFVDPVKLYPLYIMRHGGFSFFETFYFAKRIRQILNYPMRPFYLSGESIHGFQRLLGSAEVLYPYIIIGTSLYILKTDVITAYEK